MRAFALIIIAALILTALITSILEWYKKVPTGKAIIRNGFGGAKVVFDGGIFVIPEIQSLDIIDLSIREFKINLTGREALIFKDGSPLNFQGTLYLFINPNPSAIYRVTQLIGLEQLKDPDKLHTLVEDKLKDVLLKIAKQSEAAPILENNRAFKNRVFDELGMDVLGFAVEDFVITELEEKEELKLKQLSKRKNKEP